MEDWHLLREYLERGSEPAFSALVERHVHLVYSVALRRLGDRQDAEDVTQSVFCLLAQKARRLGPDTALVGWLYKTACFKASRYQRSEYRQRQRELKAALMQSIDTTPDPAWERIRPHLEEAMSRLGDQDRLAVLLRFFQRKPLKEVGEVLGVGEDAARMRVDRALEKLRAALAKRGVTSTAVALAAVLAEGAVGVAPSGLSAIVSQAALASVATYTGFALTLSKLAGSLPFKLALGTALVIGASLLVQRHPPSGSQGAGTAGNQVALKQTQTTGSRATVAESMSASPTSADLLASSNKLVLHIVSSDSGKPITNAEIDSQLREVTNGVHTRFQVDRLGVCEIPVPRDTVTLLLLTSQIDGFADTSLLWTAERGGKIPGEYTLRLTHAVWIGGMVVDADGRPVAGARVAFGSSTPSKESRTATEFHVTGRFETTTDPQGRWSLNRMAPEVFRRVEEAGAIHPDLGSSRSLSVFDHPEAAEQLLAGTFVFHLEGAGTVALRGIVVNSRGEGVPGATVMASPRPVSGVGLTRRTTTQSDGSFSLIDCTAGPCLIQVIARGFVRLSEEVDVETNSAPIRAILQSGNLVKLRVVGVNGSPVGNAHVTMQPIEEDPVPAAASNGVSRGVGRRGSGGRGFSLRTDPEGRIDWAGAVVPEFSCVISADGYGEASFQVKPAAEEQLIRMPEIKPLTISGTICDLTSGEAIPHFRIITGSPQPDRATGMTNARWSTFSPTSPEDGVFRQDYFYSGSLAGGSWINETNIIFKFEAEGHAPFATRVVRSDEGEVRFDVKLRAAASVTVTVLLPNGTPAANADVGLLTAAKQALLIPGGFYHARGGGPSPNLAKLLTTDDHGRFILAPDDEVTAIVVPHPDGYGEATPSALVAEPTLRLQPWSRLEGTFLSGGNPAAGRTLSLMTAGETRSRLQLMTESWSLETDASGHFAFPKVPPGRFEILRGSPVSVSSRPVPWLRRPALAEVTVQPAETKNVTVGAYTLTAHLVWPANLKREANWQVQVWFLPETTSQMMQFTETTSDVFIAEDVPAGNYRVRVLSGAVVKGRPGLKQNAEVQCAVPADPASGTLDLGEIVLQPAQ